MKMMDFARVVQLRGLCYDDGTFLEDSVMPELPEVETMVRGLRPALLGRLVERSGNPRSFPAPGLRRRGI